MIRPQPASIDTRPLHAFPSASTSTSNQASFAVLQEPYAAVASSSSASISDKKISFLHFETENSSLLQE
jgi:hypothetical protein